MSLILIIIVLIIVFGGAGYGVRGTYANGPYIGGGLGLVLLLVLIWLLLGRGSIVL